ncbi:hypothetical protein JCM2811A_19430 [Methylorubrum rhodinum]
MVMPAEGIGARAQSNCSDTALGTMARPRPAGPRCEAVAPLKGVKPVPAYEEVVSGMRPQARTKSQGCPAHGTTVKPMLRLGFANSLPDLAGHGRTALRYGAHDAHGRQGAEARDPCDRAAR